MRAVIDYIVVEADMGWVAEKIEAGWQPWGSVVQRNGILWQPMVRYADLM